MSSRNRRTASSPACQSRSRAKHWKRSSTSNLIRQGAESKSSPATTIVGLRYRAARSPHNSSLPGVNHEQPDSREVGHFPRHDGRTCSRAVAASKPSTTASGRPFICAWARSTPHRSAKDLLTGRTRPSNHAGKSRSSHSSNCVRCLPGGRSSNSESDFCKCEDARVKRGWISRLQPLLDQRVGSPRRLNSERTFVSRRNRS